MNCAWHVRRELGEWGRFSAGFTDMVGDTDRDCAYLMALSASKAFGHSSELAYAFAGRIADIGQPEDSLRLPRNSIGSCPAPLNC